MNIVIYFFSPTLFLARKMKKRWNRTRVIKNLNNIYLIISIITVMLFLGFYDKKINYEYQSFVPSIILGYYLWSRALEIIAAFIFDAVDKTRPVETSKSNLTPKDRVVLSLKSYIELILIFAIGYFIMPCSWWSEAPRNVLEAIYFSGVTITTLGYGDIHPIHPFSQLLTIFEVLCGFSLLVVSFAIYTNMEESG